MRLTTLFNLIKRYYWIIQAAIIIVLFFSLKKEKQKTEGFKEIYRVKQKEIEIWKDDARKNRIRAEIAEIDAANARLVLKEDLKRTIQREVGNLRRNLICYPSVEAATSGSFQTTSTDTVYMINEIEPLPAKKFKLNKPDLKFNGLFVPSLDTLMVDYRIIHNFDIFYYYKRPGKAPFNIFKRKRVVAEIKFDNPGSQADSLFTLVLDRKKRFFKGFITN